jgi:cytochrome c oxidase cbb3-type subunit III
MNDVTHDTKVVIDPITGTATTGHEWDGLQELNTPLPRWWLWLFYATIIWAIGYWIMYPAWPFITSYSQGLFGWHSRNAIVSDLDGLRAQRGPMMQKLASASLDQIAADPQLLDFARAVGKSAFAENCAACHGAGGAGAKGIRISTMTIGSGAASLRTSSKRSPTVSAPLIPTPMRAL